MKCLQQFYRILTLLMIASASQAETVLLIPDSGGTNFPGRVLAFSPVDGHFVREIIPSTTRLETPKNAIDSGRGTLLVSDQAKNAIIEFKYDGSFVRSFIDDTNQQIKNPRAIAIKDGKLYVPIGPAPPSTTSIYEKTVQRFNLDGSGRVTWATSAHLSSPYDILFRALDVLVCDGSANAVRRYNPDGSFVADFITSSGVNNLDFPQQIIETSNARIFAAGSLGTVGTGRGLYEYDATGTRLNFYPHSPGPRGIYLLQNGLMLLSCPGVVRTYNLSTGAIVDIYGSVGSTNDFQLIEPVTLPDSPTVNFTGTVKLSGYLGTVTPISAIPATVTVNGETPLIVTLNGSGNQGTFTVAISSSGENTIKVQPRGFLSQTNVVPYGTLSAMFDNGGSGLIPGDTKGSGTAVPDNKVDDFDLTSVIFDFGYSGSYPTANGYSDTNGDGKTNDFDLAAVIFGFGKIGS